MAHMMIIYLIPIIARLVSCGFDVTMPVISHEEGLESRLALSSKQVYINLDIAYSFFDICCKPNRGLFQIIHNFLSNPFFQINQYTCPNNSTSFQTAEVRLPAIGVLSVQHNLIEYPQCTKGILGLSKQSVFMGYLPINSHTLRIQVNNNQASTSTLNNKIGLAFGQVVGTPQNSWVFNSNHPEYWDIEAKSIQLGPLTIQSNPKIVFTSMSPYIKIPIQFYQKIATYYPSNQTCRIYGQKLLCLCESGIPAFFPRFYINLANGEKLQVAPQMYMSIDSNICTLQLEPSPDQNWFINIKFFSNTIFYFDRNSAKIIIQKVEIAKNESSQLISLPIPLILNCAVVLLLCIFASLVIIEITKRITGLSQLSGDNLIQHIMRRNLA